MMKQLKVLVAVPSMTSVDAQFMNSVVGLLAKNCYDGLNWGYLNCQGSVIAANRCDLVDNSLEQDCSHILFVDSDMVFPQDALFRLLSHMKPIVAANYVQKQIPAEPVTMGLDMQRCTSIGKTGLEKVRGIGMGLALIETEVFRNIKQPWFNNIFNTADMTYTAEDWCFCQNSLEAGYDIWIDHDLSQVIEHRGVYNYSWKDCAK